jgi:DNA-binding XRE family transcriptional regulator
MSEQRDSQENLNPCAATVDAKGIPYSARLKRLREATGKTPHDMAALVGVSSDIYYDWEWGDGDISRTASLAELAKLATSLGVGVLDIFDDGPIQGEHVRPEQLSEMMKAHIKRARLSTAQFEERVGFEMEPALNDPAEILNWNLDCLRFVCNQIGLDWRLALP